jgi:hypothetical protein
MNMLISLIVVIVHNAYVYQNLLLYTSKTLKFYLLLYLNKLGGAGQETVFPVRRGGNEAWSTESDIPGGEALK